MKLHKKILFQIKKFRYILRHLLNTNNKILAVKRFLWWNIILRNVKYNVISPYLNNSLLIGHYKDSETLGNFFTGLNEFNDMSFLLHFLRKSDVLYDVGANIGCYTILASNEIGCKTIAFEPVRQTYSLLEKNIKINNIEKNVKLLNIAIGSRKDSVLISNTGGTTNHVIYQNSNEPGEKVAIQPLNYIIENNPLPSVLKIDVEGSESAVLKGASNLLEDKNLNIIIIELNGSGQKYGFLDKDINTKLINSGFIPYKYEPFSRKLQSLKKQNKTNNTLYIRDYNFVNNRIQNGDKFNILNNLI